MVKNTCVKALAAPSSCTRKVHKMLLKHLTTITTSSIKPFVKMFLCRQSCLMPENKVGRQGQGCAAGFAVTDKGQVVASANFDSADHSLTSAMPHGTSEDVSRLAAV